MNVGKQKSISGQKQTAKMYTLLTSTYIYIPKEYCTTCWVMNFFLVLSACQQHQQPYSNYHTSVKAHDNIKHKSQALFVGQNN